jgi:UDP-galactopyranose mutase
MIGLPALSAFPMVSSSATDRPDVVCFSHLRWDFVFQRPQHLLTRCARLHRVFFVEEPVHVEGSGRMDVHVRQNGVRVVVPRFSASITGAAASELQARLLRGFLRQQQIDHYVFWYYTPMACEFTRDLRPAAVVYDCMDQLSAFAGAPPTLRTREQELLTRAQVVFTGGQTLYESKRHEHPNVHAFPSSVDVGHFARARTLGSDPADQASIPHVRLGFFGVLDERIDLELLAGLAMARPAHRQKHSLSRQQAVRGVAVVPCRAGRSVAAVRTQRRDPLHQPNEDAGVPRSGQAGRLHVDSRRRAPLWDARTRTDRR